MPVWGRSEEGTSHSLIITKLGRTAIKAKDDRVLEDAKSVVPRASTDQAAAQSGRSAPRHDQLCRHAAPKMPAQLTLAPGPRPLFCVAGPRTREAPGEAQKRAKGLGRADPTRRAEIGA